MNLRAFLACPRTRAAYLEEPGFSTFYVRKGAYAVELESGFAVVSRSLQLANLGARPTGQGTFTALVARLRREYPDLPLVAENVIRPRFAAKLLSLGFERTVSNAGRDFVIGWSHDPDARPERHPVLLPELQHGVV